MYIMFTETYVYIPVADLEGACDERKPITRESDDENETVWRNLNVPRKWSFLFK